MTAVNFGQVNTILPLSGGDVLAALFHTFMGDFFAFEDEDDPVCRKSAGPRSSIIVSLDVAWPERGSTLVSRLAMSRSISIALWSRAPPSESLLLLSTSRP